jgi:hypothetical protein
VNVAGQGSVSGSVTQKQSSVSSMMDGPLEAGFDLVSDEDLVAGYKKTSDEAITEIKNSVESNNRDMSLQLESFKKEILAEFRTVAGDMGALKKGLADVTEKQSSMDKNVGRILQGQEAKVKVLENKMEKTVEGVNNFFKNPELIDSLRGQLERNEEQIVLEKNTQEKAKQAVQEMVGGQVPVGVQETIENQASRQKMLQNKVKQKKSVPQLQLDFGEEQTSAGTSFGEDIGNSTGLPSFEVPNSTTNFSPNAGFDGTGIDIAAMKFSPEGVMTLGQVDLSKGTAPRVTMTIPALSKVKARVVHGLLAPADGNPAPILFHVGQAWVGPMHSRTPLQGIMMLGMAKGKTNGSRAEIELSIISGVTPNGEAFTVNARGYVLGPDGHLGIKGILRDVPPGYWKKVTPLNFLSAGAAALAETTTQTQSDISGQQFSNIKAGKELSNAAYSALSATISDAANVFNRRLRDWKTAVEIDPLQDVTLILVDEVPVEAMSVSMNSPGYGARPKSYVR